MRSNDEIMEILDRLKEEQDLSVSEIARRVGMAKSAVSRYFNRTREFPLNRVDDFAKAFNVKPEYLLGIDFPKPTNIVFPEKITKIPMIGTIAAGVPILAEQNIDDYLPVVESSVPKGKIIALSIQGNSMSPGIPDKSNVLIRLQPNVEDGVSVFELKERKPVLSNLQLVESFSGRFNIEAFIVTGEKIGVGYDGEPLLKNVKYVAKKSDIDFMGITLEVLDNNFNSKTGSYDEEDKEIHQNYANGEQTILFGGFTYSEPVSEFESFIGRKELKK